MINVDRILERTNIQQIRSLFLEGADLMDYHNKIDNRSYNERLEEAKRPITEFIEIHFKNETMRDEVLDMLTIAITANEEVYTEIGIRLGAQLMFELLGKKL